MRPLVVIVLFFIAGQLVSQDAFRELDKVYGLDPLLFNGEKYTYFLPSGTGGNQYLLSPDFVSGEVTIKGKRFEGIDLNYDIYNQQLLLQYDDGAGASGVIAISKAWLDGFILENMKFIYFRSDQAAGIYQVLGEGPFYILYYWWKDMRLDNSGGSANFTFTSPKKNRYVLINGKLLSFTGRRSLVSLFDPVHRDEINNYIRDHRIDVKKAGDQSMSELIGFIGKL